MEIMHLEKAARLMGGDQQLFADLFAVIEAALAERYQNLEAALAQRDAEAIELYAHQLKGALRNVAADEACQLLETIEKCGLNGQIDQAIALYPQVPPTVDRLLAYYHSGAWTAAFAASS